MSVEMPAAVWSSNLLNLTQSNATAGTASTERAASTLLTIAQVNATILAFLFGLGIVGLQLASRYAIPNLKFRSGGTWFLMVYGLIGVIAPLVLSLKPSELEAWAMCAVSILFLFLAPFFLARTMRAGLPQHLAANATALTMRRWPRNQKDSRLAQAHQTLAALRAETPPGTLRDEMQSRLLDALSVALEEPRNSGEARAIIRTLIGTADDDAEQRLTQLGEWLYERAAVESLSLCPPAASEAWSRLCDLALRAGADRLYLAEKATRLASRVAAGQVWACYERSAVMAMRDKYGRAVVEVCDLRGQQPRDVLRSIASFASLLLDEVPTQQRGRSLLSALLRLLNESVAEIRLGNDFPLDVVLPVLDDLYERQLAGLAIDGSADQTEARHRLELIMVLPLTMLESAQHHAYLNTSAGRRVLRAYLAWLLESVRAGDRWLFFELQSELRRRVSRGFMPARNFGSKTAYWHATEGLLVAMVPLLADISAALHARELSESWNVDTRVWLDFDVVSWGHESRMGKLARELLPAFDDAAFAPYLRGETDHVSDDLSFIPMRRYDPLREWLTSNLRPDAALAILLRRWRRALSCDYLRPGLRARRDREYQNDMLVNAEGARLEALKELFARKQNDPPPDLLLPLILSRDLLVSVCNLGERIQGVGGETLSDWGSAAASWLEATRGDGDPDVNDFLVNIRALSTDDARIAHHLRHPCEEDDSIRTSMWQTVFGFVSPIDQMFVGRKGERRQADLPERSYCLLPESANQDHRGYVFAIEDDQSVRLLVLEDASVECEELIPMSHRYMPGVILGDCLDDLVLCTKCFGALRRLDSAQLLCPECGRTGRLPMYEVLLDATWSFVQAAGWGSTFSSRALRRHLAHVVEEGAVRSPSSSS